MRALMLLLVTMCLALPAVAEEAAPGAVDLTFAVKAGDVSRYNIKVRVIGKNKLPGEAQPVPVDSTMDIAVAVSAGEKSKDGSFPMFVTCEKASATIGDQTISLAATLFPKMTVMIDKNGAITRIFPPDPVRSKQPGINYRSFVMLLNPNAPAGAQKIGATWKKSVAIPSEMYQYDLAYTLQAFEVDTARVRCDITLSNKESAYSVTGFAVGNYSLDGARLVKSHSEITVKTPNPAPTTPSGAPAADTPGEIDAVIKVDITRTGTTTTGK